MVLVDAEMAEDQAAFAVMAIPTAEDQGGLVAETPWGWAPAVAWLDHQPDGWHWRVGNTRNAYALPLWWEGHPVPDGIARALWAAGPHVWPPPAPWEWNAGQVIRLAELLVNLGLVERVVILDKVNGKLVERPRAGEVRDV